MDSYPKISIITPCFNAEKYIEQTITSILNQNYNNLEYIIIDGGSTDSTVDIIKKYQDKIAYWVSEKDYGQSDAINKGLAKATGEVFNWINADDYLAPRALQLVGNYFMDKNLDLLCTPSQLFNDKGNIRINNFTDIRKSTFELLNSTGMNQQGMYWKMDKIKQLNGVNTAFNYSMDLDLWKRFLLTFGKDYAINDETITSFFRLHNDSKTGNDFDINFSFFEKENNAALHQYARVAGKKYLRGINYLYPICGVNLSKDSPISNLPVENIKHWLNDLFFNNAKRAFYANEFKKTYTLLNCIEKQYLPQTEHRNIQSWKRWSLIKYWI